MTLPCSATPPSHLAAFVLLGLGAATLHAQAPPVSTQTIDVNGITTKYHAAGLDHRRPGQPVVVFQSGGGGTPLESWAAVLAGLEDRAAVLAYDRPGIGGTSPPEESLTLALVSEHLHDLLEILDIAPPYVLVGHSWGGPLILDYALRYPDEVVGSIHVDPFTFLMADHDHMTVVMRSAEVSYAEADSIMKAFEEEWEQPGGFSTDHLPPGLAAESDLMREYSQTSPHADIPPPAHPITVLLALRPMAPPPFPESMDPLEWFRVERQFTRNQFEEWLDDQPDSSVRLLPESTHEVPQEAPEATVEAIDTMLQVIRSEPGRQDPGAPHSLAGQEVRARDLGVPFDGIAGVHNAITDVPGVEVGHTTLIRGDGPLIKGEGPVRTGVTAILPRGRTFDPVFAATYALNGNGEMTGIHWIEESGFLETPILITNTFSVGVVRDATMAWMDSTGYNADPEGGFWYTYPVVAETYDVLNDILGQHVTRAHAFQALNDARPGPVAEGNVGGGTGMIAHGFKAGIGTASRLTASGHTLGVLVQANYGGRDRFTVAGVPVGEEITDLQPNYDAIGRGSIIVVVATDAPLIAPQLQRLVERVPIAIGRMGGVGSNGSGDIFIAFSTANPGAWAARPTASLEILPNADMSTLFEATVGATEEAILNAMVAAETMTGRDGLTVHALPHDRLREALRKYGRWVDPGSQPRAVEGLAAELDRWTGTYHVADMDYEIRLYVEDGKLFYQRGANRLRIVPMSDGQFLVLGPQGVYLEEVPGETDPLRLRLVRGEEVLRSLERTGDGEGSR